MIFYEGWFYVIDIDNDCVKVFDICGIFLRIFVDGFSVFFGIVVYKGKYFFVCDYSNDCVKICFFEGWVLSLFGSKGDGIN